MDAAVIPRSAFCASDSANTPAIPAAPDGLDAKTRMLVTIAAMTVQGALAEPQLRLTIRHAIEAGATPREIAEVIYQMGMFGGLPAMQKALEIAQGVFTESEGSSPE